MLLRKRNEFMRETSKKRQEQSSRERRRSNMTNTYFPFTHGE